MLIYSVQLLMFTIKIFYALRLFSRLLFSSSFSEYWILFLGSDPPAFDLKGIVLVMMTIANDRPSSIM